MLEAHQVRHVKVGVAMITGSQAYRRTFGCLVDMLAFPGESESKAVIGPGWRVETVVMLKASSILAQGRQELMDDAIVRGCTHILCIDSDQTFPPRTMFQLLKWRKPVVACNVPTKQFPRWDNGKLTLPSPTARAYDGTPGGKPVFTTGDSQELRRIWRIGTGIMLIELDYVKRLPKPWFLDTWKEAEQKHQGEDWYFCELLEKYDIPIFIDQGLSWEVGHIGDCEYRHEMTLVAGRYQSVGADGTMKEKLNEVA